MKFRNRLKYLLMPVGAVAGYLYFANIGCATGTCPISSNGYIMTFYGATLGFFIGNIFTPLKKKEAEKAGKS